METTSTMASRTMKALTTGTTSLGRDNVQIDPLSRSPSRIRHLSTGGHLSSAFSPSSEFIVSRIDRNGNLQIISYRVNSYSSDNSKPGDGSGLLWQSSIRNRHTGLPAPPIQSSSVPFDLEVIIQGFCEFFSSARLAITLISPS
jgi:hypothetical protein